VAQIMLRLKVKNISKIYFLFQKNYKYQTTEDKNITADTDYRIPNIGQETETEHE